MQPRKLSISLLLGLGLTLIIGMILANAQATPEAEPMEVDLPPGAKDISGVTAEWWVAVQDQLGQDMAPMSLQDSTADWTATGENTDDGFGVSAATAGDVNGDGYADVVVGAYGYPNGVSQGKIYIYHGSASGPSTTAAISMTGENNNDQFGRSVGTAGDVNGDGYADVIVGASYYPSGANWGAAYVYYGSPSGLSATAAVSMTGENTNDFFGSSVGTAGDVNGDGYADVAVGAVRYPSGAGQGKAYIYHGSPSGLSPIAAVSITGENNNDNFGQSVGTAGDANGDGYADVVVGAPYYPSGARQGATYVYHGSPSGLSATAAISMTGENNNDQFGESVGTAGDVNGDGYADIIVGAYAYPSFAFQGAAYVYHGSPSGLSATAAISMTGENNNDALFMAGTAGDVNGDGYADVIIGALNYPAGNGQGAVYVYHGSVSGLSATAAVSMTGENDNDRFGISVGTAGDVNGDGYADVIVGAPYYPPGAGLGKTYVYHGGGETLSTAAWTKAGENDDDQFGISVASAGDVNGDGYTDVVVGAPYYDVGVDTNEGAAYVYHGSASGLSTTAAVSMTGENAGDLFGYSVGTAGDVNGDGYC